MQYLKLLLAAGALALGGCTSLLGDFSYDDRPASSSNSGGSGNDPNLKQGDIVVMPTGGLVTSESGTKAAFTIVLKHEPTDTVAIALTSSNLAEGTVSPNTLSFTPDNWAAPQMAQVTGVDDDKEDGPQKFVIKTSPATSNDKTYYSIDPIDPDVTNIDNDTAGITLMPSAGLVTTESGGEAKFGVVLNHAPKADVTIPLSSDNPAEGTVSPASLTFTALNWMAPQMVTVTGVNDDAKDGPQKYHALTGPAMSGDGNYNGVDGPDAEIINQDNDSAGVMLTPSTGLLTFENGTMTSFTIALSSPPTGDVTIKLESDDVSEGTVSPMSVTFTPLNWMAPQVISVTGVNDDRVDGNQPYHIKPTIESSADPDYATLEPPDVEVTNIDDDTPGLTLKTTTLETNEDRQSVTFTVELNSKPSGSVVLDVESSRPEEGLATPTQLTFTEENWNGPQIVTVMGVDDDVADGNQAYVVHVRPNAASTDPAYAVLLEQDVALTNVDNDSAGVTVTAPKDLKTKEDGSTGTFTIVLNSKPRADVSIALGSSNTAEGSVSPDKVTFTPDNWKSPQTVTLRGVDDSMQDGNQPYKIITQNAVSDDPGYSGMEVPNVDATNVDNDTAGISVMVAANPLVTTEAGGTATFTVVLNSQPAKDTEVSFNLTSSDTTEGTVNPGTLKFTGANWNAPQTVTVKGVDDKLDDGRQAYRISFGTISSADPNYAGDKLKPLDVAMANSDNDTAGITLSDVSALTTTEKNAGTATFTVKLDTEPTANVTIGVSSSRTAEGTVAPAQLVFTPVNWNAPQTVTLTGVDDKVADGNQQYLVLLAPAVSMDKNYATKLPPNANITVTNLDDDSPGVRVTAPPGISTSEPATTATFTVELLSQPTADVTIPLASSKTSEGTVSPASLTFTAQNWNAPRTVTLTGANDNVQDGNQPYAIKFGPIASADAKYKAITVPDLAVTNRDDDTAAILVSPISGDTTEKNTGTATFTIALQTQPTANVTIALTSSDTSEGTVSPALVTFTAVNWASPQVITVTGVDDKVQDGNQPYTIDIAAAMSADGNYDGKDPADVSLFNKDDDTANITVGKISGNTSESGGTATFSIVLDTQPTADVSIGIASSNTAEGTVSEDSVTFTPANWSSPQVITVTGVDDDSTADGGQPYTINFGVSKSNDKNYNGRQPASLSLFNLDNDTPNIIVSATKGSTSEDGTTFTFTINLLSKPKANVTIPIASSDEGEGTVSTDALVFTGSNWSSKQSVTVTGVNDSSVDGSAAYTILIGAPTSTDTAYADIDPTDISMTNLDNDSAGFVVGDAAGHTTEAGGTTTFTMRLLSKPKGDVTVKLSSSDNTEGTTMTSVVFTPADWNNNHVVTVHGEDDDVQDGPQPYTILTGAAESTDGDYDGMAVKDVAVVNDDNDTAGFTLGTPSGDTNEDGGTATFTVVLNSQPTDDVSIPISSSNTLEGTLTITSVDFTTANWKTPKTVTVKGVDDDVKDGNVEYTIVLGKPTTGDVNYAKLNPPDVTLTNDDNDTAALSIDMPASNVTTEAGGSVTFNVTLTSKPKNPVTVPLLSSDEAEGVITTPASGSLVFDASNWSTPHPVTVTGVDDMVVDNDHLYKIQLGPADSADPNYGSLGAQFVNLVNQDDDVAPPPP
jgi:hypothetical protein